MGDASSLDPAILKSILRHRTRGTGAAVASGFGQYAAKEAATPSTASRVSVAHADNVQFLGSFTKKESSSSIFSLPHSKINFKTLLVKIGWAFCCFLFLRLIFMERGVVDYFSKEKILQQRHQELESIYKDNQSIQDEMSRIRSDADFQRKLARDHLGVIAQDEYLILFAKKDQ